MKLDQLTYFLEAARQEHLGKAAKILAISPSAICHAISALEEEFGQELFVKRGKRIQLTEQGKLLSEKAKRVMEEVRILTEQMRSRDLELLGHFRLVGAHLVCARYLLPAWAQVQRKNPKLTCELFTVRSSEVVRGVVGGDYDFGICFNPQSRIDLASEMLEEGQLRIVVRKNHPLLKVKSGQRLKELSNYPAVLPKAFQGIDVCEKHPMFEAFQIVPRPDCLIDSYEVAIEKVGLSDSWGFFPDLFIRHNPRLQAFENPRGWRAPYYLAAVWPKTRVLPKALEELIGILKTRLQTHSK